MSNKEQMMKYLENIRFGIFADEDYQTNCKINYEEVKNGTNNFEGCPQNYGLPNAKEICDGKNDSELTQEEIMDECKEC